MAVTITDLAFGESFATDATLDTGATVTGTTANNDWFVVVAGLSNATRTITSVTDTSGNTYTQRAYIVSDAPSLDAVLYVFTAPVTTNITNGTITVNISSSAGQKIVQVYRVRPSSGTVSFIAADSTGVTGTADTLHSAATVSVTNANTIFGVAVLGTHDSITGDSDTSNGSWSSVITRLAWDGVVGSGAVCCSSQYKTVNATGNQSWSCSTTSARNSARTYLVIKAQSTEFSLVTTQGQYTLSGTAATPRLGHVPVVAGAGTYALTGTAATFIVSGANKIIGTDVGSYALTGSNVTLSRGTSLVANAGSYTLTGADATFNKGQTLTVTAGSYTLLGTDAVLTKASAGAKVLGADVGSYTLTGTDTSLLHAWRITAGDEVGAADSDLLLETGDQLLLETGDLLVLESTVGAITGGDYALTGTAATLVIGAAKSIVADVGAYALTGSDAAIVISSAKSIVADAGSYVLTGTASALTLGAVAPPPIRAMGEPPEARKKRKARDAERARARELAARARARFKAAIGRLLEGLSPEFDEPEVLAEALDSAVQASNLLYALSAPIREINAVNELIDHIRQLRIAQPIAQLHLAQAYNQAHRHLTAKAQEDTVMALLLGE